MISTKRRRGRQTKIGSREGEEHEKGIKGGAGRGSAGRVTGE